MRILWILNLELPDIAKQFGRNIVIGGWTHQLASQLKNIEGIELSVACRYEGKSYFDKYINSVHYYSFNDKSKHIKNQLHRIYDAVSPQIIHIWGTEYNHAYVALCVSKERCLIERTVISIQGLVSVYAKHYLTGLPEKVIHHRTFVELIARDIFLNIADEQKQMELRGKAEIAAIKMAKHCIGRTDWDYACVMQINSQIRYYSCNETLREEFYSDQWILEKCRRHTIFFSQSYNPIKGVHNLIEALPIVKRVFPDVRVKIVGEDVFCWSGMKNKIKKKSYKQYLKKTIKKYDLQECIEWLGKLTAKQMKEQFCNANVFVCASTIENSSNSIGEAMLLGVPIVASDVGGIKSLLEHNVEGILYQETAPYMLAAGIIKIFDNDQLALNLSRNARMRAKKTHDMETNKITLLKIYDEVRK